MSTPTSVTQAPLSFEQERMWLLEQFASGNPANHIRGALDITGALDTALLVQGINQLIARHESLRTHFAVADEHGVPNGQLIQVINAPFPVTLPITDLRNLPVADREAAAQRLVTELIQQPFILTQAPLWRVHLIRLAADHYRLMLCMHHIICDGDWSLGLFFRELTLLHEAARQGTAPALPALPLCYRDFARQQRAEFTDEMLAPALAYWQRQLGASSEVLQLPIDHPRPPVQSYRGASQILRLPFAQVAALQQLSQQAAVPCFVTLIATVKTLLYRYTGQAQIAIGSPTAGRHQSALDGVIGYFGNPVVLQTALSGELTFRALLGRVCEVTEAAKTHQRYPFQKLVEQLNLTRDLSTTPLFQVLFVMRNAAPHPWSQAMLAPQTIGELTIAPVDVASLAVPYDLFLSLQETADGLVWTWEYNADLFEHATIARMIGHCQTLLAAIVANPDQLIGQLPLLTAAERQQLFVEWNNTQHDYPQVPIHRLFEEQVERTPAAVAVMADLRFTIYDLRSEGTNDDDSAVQGGREETPSSTDQSLVNRKSKIVNQLTYRDLNTRANQLAHDLQQRGVGPDQLVALCIERSPMMMVGLLGILKAGGAYVPLDADYPAARLAYMLADSGAKILLTTQSQLDAVPQLAEAAQHCQIVCLDHAWPQIAQEPTENPAGHTTLDQLAYAIYTSGSTGQPKGAALPHRVLTNLVCWHRTQRLTGPSVRMLQVSPISFDVSAHEIFATLCTGGVLVLVSDAVRRNPLALLAYLRQQRVEKLYLPFIALQQLAEAATVEPAPTTLREVITAGEQLQITPALVRFFNETGATLHNHYGGTEIQDITALTLMGDAHQWPTLPSIGRPIDNVQIYILDQLRQPVPIGVAGELYVGGDALARGYLNRPELTAERFIYDLRFTIYEDRGEDNVNSPINSLGEETTENTHQSLVNRKSKIVNHKLYKTNDLARYRPDGSIEHLGRIDNLVKIRGFRVELGEIETALNQQAAVRECVVMPWEAQNGQKQLIGYVVLDSAAATTTITGATLRAALRTRLPDYMIPTQIMLLDAMPLTPSGKVNRRALPAPEAVRSSSPSPVARPVSDTANSDLEQQLVRIWQELLALEIIDLDETFFALGGNSLLLVQAHKRLAELVDTPLSPVTLFQYPTIRALAHYLKTQANGVQPQTAPEPKLPTPPTNQARAVAIIGMACRFPGAPNVAEFWQNLRAGIETISFFGDDEIELADPGLLAQPNYVKAGAILPDIDQFDAAFFGYSAREAEVTDPQQRLLLECAWETFEQAGYNPETYAGTVGVYTGAGLSTYLINNVAPHLGFSPQRPFSEAGAFQAKLSNDRNYYGTRISYKLNLTGPSLNIQTACSTSLVTVHMACQALLNGECDMALAGGAAIVVPHKVGYPYHDGLIHSPDGHTRAFDAAAQGTLFGNGVGMVVLKLLNQALADGDHVIAVIQGSAINNDGALKMGYTAPSVAGQAAVIGKALAAAQIDAATVTYVETHGTATALGDPIEIAALTEAFHRNSAQGSVPTHSCAIGSVKTNIGHLDEAAGIAGLIKTALALYHQQIPPSLHYQRPNPQIDFANSPFYVNTALQAWSRSPQDPPRRAGVSSFGMGGTNCHVVLEEAPERQGEGETGGQEEGERPWHLLALSARSEEALQALVQRYVAYLAAQPEPILADVCFTANVGRKHFEHRRAFVAATSNELLAQLQAVDTNGADALPSRTTKSNIAWLFTGQGSQYVGMGQMLYATSPRFRQTLDRCDEILRPLLGVSLMTVLYPQDLRLTIDDLRSEGTNGDNSSLQAGTTEGSSSNDQSLVNRQSNIVNQTAYTQPALFALEYALAQLWLSWGIEPDALMGHSVGELVAACVAGVFSLEDALKLVAARGRLMHELTPTGSMLAVMADEAGIAPFLATYHDTVALAAINGPQAVVLSGDSEAIRAIDAALTAAGIKTTRLAVAHAFHSPLMEPMLAAFAQVAQTIHYARPQRKLVSNVTGTAVSDEIASADYWVNHVRQPVKFAAGMQTLHQLDIDTFIEIGPKPVLLGMGRHCLPEETGTWLPSLRPQQDDWQQLLQSLGTLYQQGVAIDWPRFDQPYHRRRVPLPTYPFQRQRYWVEANQEAWAAIPDQSRRQQTLSAQHGYHATPTMPALDWLYHVEWRPQARYGLTPTYLPTPTSIQPQLAARLAEFSQDAALARYGKTVAQLESLSIAYIVAAFGAMGWHLPLGEHFSTQQKAKELGVIELHRQLFGRFLAMLAQEGILQKANGAWTVIATPALPEPETLLAQLEASAEATLLARCGTQLAQALRGECKPTELLFPGGDTSTMAQIYRDSPILQATNRLVQQAVVAALDTLPAGRGLRILEIGAGTGGTTAHLLPHLPTTQTEYHYTDVSAFFVAKAEEAFQAYPFVRYAVLDIEQDPVAQGFAAQQFDLIVAADVLHATRDMHQTMSHVRKLLAPNGLLVLMEDTAPLYWIDLTFGLTEGWWRFTDRSLRPDHPLLSVATWQTLLPASGFTDVTVTSTAALTGEKMPHEAVIVARAANEQLSAERDHWLILADEQEKIGTQVAELLAAQHQPCTVVFAGETYQQQIATRWPNFTINPANPDDFQRLLQAIPAVDGVLHCWSLGGAGDDVVTATMNSCGSTLHLVQALLKHKTGRPNPRLWLVTQGAQAVQAMDLHQPLQSALWGVGKIIALEHPELHCVCIDLDPATPAQNALRLFAEICDSPQPTPTEEQLALRGQQRYVARLARVEQRAQLDPIGQLKISEGSYLITGGLGGLGLRVAEFLVARGARHLALLGRSAPNAEALAQIRKLEQAGAQISVIQCDVAERTQLAAALAQIEANLPPLRGVIHAAGVLADGTIQQQNWTRFATVMAPKAYGAWHLHELTQHQPLDFFVLFSSSSALLGTAGQVNHVAANTFLDALAAYRRGQGLPGLAINWGAWSAVGAVARMGVLDHLRERGEGSIDPAQGIACLEQLLLTQATQQSGQIGVMPIDWPRFLQKRLTHSPFFADFTAPSQGQIQGLSDQSPEQTVRQQLETATGEERQRLLVQQVKAVVIQVLGWNATRPLSTTLGFFDLGLDSLTAIELRNRLNRSLACTLPVTLAFDYPTVAELVAYLGQTLFASSLADAPSTLSNGAGSAVTPIDGLERQVQPSVAALSEAEAEALLLQELEGLTF